jgi:hypothetical protein
MTEDRRMLVFGISLVVVINTILYLLDDNKTVFWIQSAISLVVSFGGTWLMEWRRKRRQKCESRCD